MTPKREACIFQCHFQEYHADALTYACAECGLKMLGTCDVHFTANDEEKQVDQADSSDIREKRITDNSCLPSRRIFSKDWIDGMIAEKRWFKWLYDKFAPLHYKEMRYLENHQPCIQVIHHNILYDTQKSKMFYMDERHIGKSTYRRYNYVTPSNRYYKIVVSYGKSDEFSVMTINEVKMLLSHKADIYKEVIPEAVEE